jgi:deazaflavin-dependent oxidoreductase (nitroreductase family)
MPDFNYKAPPINELNELNRGIIAEFRANEGRVGGPFEGAPLLLVHHVGRTSGKEYVNPVSYLPDDGDDDSMYIFATLNGGPTNPSWYYNLTTAGEATVERGTSAFPVTVTDVTGDERDRIYAEQVKVAPNFADYAKKAEGIRVIPVLRLTRR